MTLPHTLAWLAEPIRPLDQAALAAASERQAQLTKPPGALGELEALAIRLAGLQGRACPRVDRPHICVFAADHGVAAEGVSAFPQSVTVEMIRNFSRGGAAISVLARALGASFEILNLGTATVLDDLPGLIQQPLGPGSANLAQEPAMSESQLAAAMNAGRASVERAQAAGTELYIAGEMGIANTTPATALACVLLDIAPEILAGPGSGLDSQGVSRKAQVVARALALHGPELAQRDGPTAILEILRRLGGFEIAAMVGAYVRASQLGLAVVVDGFISSAAALVASRLTPGSSALWLYGHSSAEPGHARILAALNARPLLQLGMRLGEGSGAATSVPLLRLACELHAGMATFAEAGISAKL